MEVHVYSGSKKIQQANNIDHPQPFFICKQAFPKIKLLCLCQKHQGHGCITKSKCGKYYTIEKF